MSNAKSSVFYGLFVESTSICIAARAWKLIELVLRVVELVKARQIKGTLTLTKVVRAGFTWLPNELIELVVELVVASTWVEAENSFVRDFHWWEECGCKSCEAAYNEMLCLAHLDKCEMCTKWLFYGAGLLELLSYKKRNTELEALLSAFGLRLLSSKPVMFEERPPLSSLVSPLAIRLSQLSFLSQPPSPNLEPSVNQQISYDSPDTAHAFTTLTSALEALPSNAATRFRKFLRLLPIETIHQDDLGVKPKPKEQGGKEQKQPEDKLREKKRREESKKPEWHLWADGSEASW
ncbi:hypothetical protein JCM8547_002283 [Rhodosporidiobolus lusitaniae]